MQKKVDCTGISCLSLVLAWQGLKHTPTYGEMLRPVQARLCPCLEASDLTNLTDVANLRFVAYFWSSC